MNGRLESSKFNKIIRFVLLGMFIVIPLIYLPELHSEVKAVSKWVLLYIGTAIMAFLWLLKAVKEKRLVIRKSPLYMPMALFIYILGISSVVSFNGHEALRISIQWLTMFTLLFIAINTLDGKTVKKIIYIIISIGIFTSLYDIYLNKGIDFLSMRDLHAATFGHVNFASQFIIIPIAFLFCYFYGESNFIKKAIYAIALIAPILFLIITRTRGAWFAFFVSFSFITVYYIGLYTKRHGVTKKFISIILLVFLVIAISVPFIKDIPEMRNVVWRFKSTFNLVETTVGLRLQLWKGCLKGVKDNPYFGIGPGNFRIFSQTYKDLKNLNMVVRYRNFSAPENQALHVLCETGITGFIAFMWFLLVVFYMTAKGISQGIRESRFIYEIIVPGAGLIAILSHSVFASNFLIPATGMCLFFVIAAISIYHSETKNKPYTVFHLSKLFKAVVGLFAAVLLLLSIFWSVKVYLSERYLLLGFNNFERKDYKTAIEFFEKSLKYDEYHIQTNFSMAKSYFLQKDYPNALEYYFRTIKLFPYYSAFYVDIATIYGRAGNLNKAERYLKEALDIDSTNADANYYMGIVNLKRSNRLEAEAYFNKAIGYNRNHKPAREMLEKLHEKSVE